IIKALNLYRKKTGTENFFWIHLDKRVPTGAGLGGGSSNAATALWAANQFNGCPATEKELQEWSSEIGSDVPFFFSQGAAYCTGRGEVSINTSSILCTRIDREHPGSISDWNNLLADFTYLLTELWITRDSLP
ncbi:4-diphosphocytidyl-2-C-methyl-D-erythritol kinase, partial [Trifolium medium]|nr:4-diphosphocytidyl-2-C-methyl-D-erythritol kinase [Trifolium medium]